MSKKMSAEEIKQWDNLYQYVRKEIMNYDDNQGLPNKIVLRLKGLTNGRFFDNNSQKVNAKYSYEIILYTFKMNKQVIMNAINGKNFSDDIIKFIYIATIVENSINDVYNKIMNAKKAKEKTENVNIDSIGYEGADYIRKTSDNKVNKKLEGLW